MKALLDILNKEKEMVNLLNQFKQKLEYELHYAEERTMSNEEIKDLQKDIMVGMDAVRDTRKELRMYLLDLFREE